MKPANPIGRLWKLNRTSHNRPFANAILALAIAIMWLGGSRDLCFHAVKATFARRASTFDAGSWSGWQPKQLSGQVNKLTIRSSATRGDLIPLRIALGRSRQCQPPNRTVFGLFDAHDQRKSDIGGDRPPMNQLHSGDSDFSLKVPQSLIRYQRGSPRSVFVSTASALDCPMLRTPLTRFAQCAVFVAAIISALIPPSSLACTHCLLRDVIEIAGHNSDCEHDHDEHSCEAPCSESNDSDLRANIRTTITIRTAIVRAASVVLKTHYCFLVQLID